MNISCPAGLDTPFGTITFNAANGDTYVLQPDLCDGLDMPPVRATHEPAPQTHGSRLHTNLLEGFQPTLGGYIRIDTPMSEAAELALRQTMEDNLIAACRSILALTAGTPLGTWRMSPGGQAERRIAVQCDLPARFTGAWRKTFAFGLISPASVWS